MAVPQTHRVHCIQVSNADEVKVADTTSKMKIGYSVCRICNTGVTFLTEEDAKFDNWTLGYCKV